MKINENFSLLRSNYLFSTMSRKIKDYKIAHPEADIIDLGIGDVSRPLPEACIKAMHSAVNEMADAATFRGYPPERGYDFLIDKILKYDFAARGITLERDEIFISDGAKSDTGSIGDIFSPECKVAVCDPVYPVWRAGAASRSKTADFQILLISTAPQRTDLSLPCRSKMSI